jgi:acetyltransferase-like isoleucine patch superfamily enzyme
MKNVICLVLFMLPACKVKNRALSLVPGYTVARDARVGPCLLWAVSRVTVRSRTTIRAGSTFRNLSQFDVGEDTVIGRANWVSANPVFLTVGVPDSGKFVIGRQSAVTSRHRIDCSGGVTIGNYSVVAGHTSSILSHSVDILESIQRAQAVRIGDYCFIGTGCIITAGVDIVDRVVIGAGSVVAGSLLESGSLYAGVPARRKKNISSARYFVRPVGPVSPK